jgi:hypothetical protein
LNSIEDEVNASINDDTASEWSVLDEVPLRTPPGESGSEWSVLDEMPLGPDLSECGSEWSLVSSIHIPPANHIPDVDLGSLPDTPSLSNLRCHLCPLSRKPFRNSAAIKAHISSAAHAPKIFHCPLAFVLTASPNDARRKERHFATLGGLAQHLESGACRGGAATFINVMNYVEEQLESLGFGCLKLLLD